MSVYVTKVLNVGANDMRVAAAVIGRAAVTYALFAFELLQIQ